MGFLGSAKMVFILYSVQFSLVVNNMLVMSLKLIKSCGFCCDLVTGKIKEIVSWHGIVVGPLQLLMCHSSSLKGGLSVAMI